MSCLTILKVQGFWYRVSGVGLQFCVHVLSRILYPACPFPCCMPLSRAMPSPCQLALTRVKLRISTPRDRPSALEPASRRAFTRPHFVRRERERWGRCCALWRAFEFFLSGLGSRVWGRICRERLALAGLGVVASAGGVGGMGNLGSLGGMGIMGVMVIRGLRSGLAIYLGEELCIFGICRHMYSVSERREYG